MQGHCYITEQHTTCMCIHKHDFHIHGSILEGKFEGMDYITPSSTAGMSLLLHKGKGLGAAAQPQQATTAAYTCHQQTCPAWLA
jgi:hypothetical protein